MTPEFIELRIKEQEEMVRKYHEELDDLVHPVTGECDNEYYNRRRTQLDSAKSQLNYFKEQKAAICGWQ